MQEITINIAKMDLFNRMMQSKFIVHIFEPLKPEYNGVTAGSKEGKLLKKQRERIALMINDMFMHWLASYMHHDMESIRAMGAGELTESDKERLSEEALSAVTKMLLMTAQQESIPYGIEYKRGE